MSMLSSVGSKKIEIPETGAKITWIHYLVDLCKNDAPEVSNFSSSFSSYSFCWMSSILALICFNWNDYIHKPHFCVVLSKTVIFRYQNMA